MKEPKRFKKSMNKDAQPPSRQWLARENRRKLWEEMQKFNGTSIGSPELDAQLRREFGDYKHDDTVGNFRLKDGSTLEATDAEPVEVDFGQIYR